MQDLGHYLFADFSKYQIILIKIIYFDLIFMFSGVHVTSKGTEISVN